MAAPDILQELESLGSEQTRKTYRRHGIHGEMFGVSYANLGKLKKRLKTDHALALALWASGNHDARVLATMIVDPARMDRAALDAWAHDLPDYVLADAFAELAVRSTDARSLAEAWITSAREYIARCGWHVLARLAGQPNDLTDAFFARYLEQIGRTIHGQQNRVREAMNSTLIAIGVRNAALEAAALTVAAAVGKVQVDHGETGCKTPDAAGYIRKTVARRAAKRPVAAAR